jgi:hypothetical protein
MISRSSILCKHKYVLVKIPYSKGSSVYFEQMQCEKCGRVNITEKVIDKKLLI